MAEMSILNEDGTQGSIEAGASSEKQRAPLSRLSNPSLLPYVAKENDPEYADWKAQYGQSADRRVQQAQQELAYNKEKQAQINNYGTTLGGVIDRWGVESAPPDAYASRAKAYDIKQQERNAQVKTLQGRQSQLQDIVSFAPARQEADFWINKLEQEIRKGKKADNAAIDKYAFNAARIDATYYREWYDAYAPQIKAGPSTTVGRAGPGGFRPQISTGEAPSVAQKKAEVAHDKGPGAVAPAATPVVFDGAGRPITPEKPTPASPSAPRETGGVPSTPPPPSPSVSRETAAPATPSIKPLIQEPDSVVPAATKQKLIQERPSAINYVENGLTNVRKMYTTAMHIKSEPIATWAATGWAHSFGEKLPGVTSAAANIETLLSQASLQAIQDMRAASKTGGAVGSVTEGEWGRLEGAYTGLKTSMQTPQFERRLKEFIAELVRVEDNILQGYANTYGYDENYKKMAADVKKTRETFGVGKKSSPKKAKPAAGAPNTSPVLPPNWKVYNNHYYEWNGKNWIDRGAVTPQEGF